MISVNFNPSVLTTQRNLNNSTNSLNTALERMSTGYKVNCAADDTAGMFVSSRLNAALRGLTQAKKNVTDGISLINTADGALSNMSDLLNRMRDLAVQGANGVYDNGSLGAMQDEADALLAQLRQVRDGASFNGRSIFGSTTASTLSLLNSTVSWSLNGVDSENSSIASLSAPPPEYLKIN